MHRRVLLRSLLLAGVSSIAFTSVGEACAAGAAGAAGGAALAIAGALLLLTAGAASIPIASAALGIALIAEGSVVGYLGASGALCGAQDVAEAAGD